MSLDPLLHRTVSLDPLLHRTVSLDRRNVDFAPHHLGHGGVLVGEDCVLHFHHLPGLPDPDAGSQVVEHLDRCLVLVVVELLVLGLGVLHHHLLLGGESFCKHCF